MYIVVTVLFNTGDHVPVMLLFEVVGNANKVEPEQIAVTELNVGVIFGITVIVISSEALHPFKYAVTV